MDVLTLSSSTSAIPRAVSGAGLGDAVVGIEVRLADVVEGGRVGERRPLLVVRGAPDDECPAAENGIFNDEAAMTSLLPTMMDERERTRAIYERFIDGMRQTQVANSPYSQCRQP